MENVDQVFVEGKKTYKNEVEESNTFPIIKTAHELYQHNMVNIIKKLQKTDLTAYKESINFLINNIENMPRIKEEDKIIELATRWESCYEKFFEIYGVLYEDVLKHHLNKEIKIEDLKGYLSKTKIQKNIKNFITNTQLKMEKKEKEIERKAQLEEDKKKSEKEQQIKKDREEIMKTINLEAVIASLKKLKNLKEGGNEILNDPDIQIKQLEIQTLLDQFSSLKNNNEIEKLSAELSTLKTIQLQQLQKQKEESQEELHAKANDFQKQLKHQQDTYQQEINDLKTSTPQTPFPLDKNNSIQDPMNSIHDAMKQKDDKIQQLDNENKNLQAKLAQLTMPDQVNRSSLVIKDENIKRPLNGKDLLVNKSINKNSANIIGPQNQPAVPQNSFWIKLMYGGFGAGSFYVGPKAYPFLKQKMTNSSSPVQLPIIKATNPR